MSKFWLPKEHSRLPREKYRRVLWVSFARNWSDLTMHIYKVPPNDSKLNEEIKESEQIFILATISVSPLPIVVVAL